MATGFRMHFLSGLQTASFLILTGADDNPYSRQPAQGRHPVRPQTYEEQLPKVPCVGVCTHVSVSKYSCVTMHILMCLDVNTCACECAALLAALQL